ncbi:MAG: MBL fold metallo-hydrolase [Deltaproteobacteria bacterium]|nr:MBL fold metallo-hydrolase [Deltaproteobacteria bacterium]
MTFRVSPLLWPAIAAGSPAIVPALFVRNRRYRKNLERAARSNESRIENATALDLPALGSLSLTVLSEWEADPGFRSEAGVSYVLRSERGAVLFDVGFGAQSGVVVENARRLGFTLGDVDALVISHMHLDHVGGLEAQKARRVAVPAELGSPDGMDCFLPDEGGAEGFSCHVLGSPRVLDAGIATIGPLARAMFFFGYIEEQVLVARLEGSGLAVITGCGHPTIEVILEMVRRLSDEPVHTVCGGLHFPLRRSRLRMWGLEAQRFFGTGKPPWSPIDDDDLDHAISVMNRAGVRRVLISAHDSDDHAIERMDRELDAEVETLRAGKTYEMR